MDLSRHQADFKLGDTNGHYLTDKGKMQAHLLARRFRDRGVRFTQVFSSDLDRAMETAQDICQQQLSSGPFLTPIQTSNLREQSFGSLEGTRWKSGAPGSSISSPDALRGGEPSYTEEESVVSMRTRVNAFLQDYIVPLLVNLDTTKPEEVIAVVSHGVILQVLWVCLADLFNQRDIHIGAGAARADFGDYVRPVWSNTGAMELDIRPSTIAGPAVRDAASPPPFLLGVLQQRESFEALLSSWSMTVMSVDDTSHLDMAQQVERTGGTVRNTLQPSRQESTNQFYRLTGTV
ncbi:histidine phosphatase family protein [Aspergillus clavatus NRRL 1]|uniref:Phosphoglycerate mutase family protein n=1 Tax=Aspergillus clavatus (strain ATCC 1007 / CBS 513.65 / DSM 816 / NCTC 3887 / NRRL 1 / QM 1276 / 107) TaxID=344612 RepID=A1CDR5_ASPCL|nr:phosphoglycerate mutase family protein [Aspergillus clavatus NRRL 1]EAW11992.1 phosphoglycerate mutase family protein [Aspergillus clavatus NRRL 1]